MGIGDYISAFEHACGLLSATSWGATQAFDESWAQILAEAAFPPLLAVLGLVVAWRHTIPGLLATMRAAGACLFHAAIDALALHAISHHPQPRGRCAVDANGRLVVKWHDEA